MPYEPTLIIRRQNLLDAVPKLESESWTCDADNEKVINYLLDVAKYEFVEFDGLQLILCTPEYSSFNYLVRDKLTKMGIDFRIDT